MKNEEKSPRTRVRFSDKTGSPWAFLGTNRINDAAEDLKWQFDYYEECDRRRKEKEEAIW